MTLTGWLSIVVLVVVLTALTPLLGGYMARVYQGERVGLSRWLVPLERWLYRGQRIEVGAEQSWQGVRALAAALQRRLYSLSAAHRRQSRRPRDRLCRPDRGHHGTLGRFIPILVVLALAGSLGP
jgi:K+-transporting ATPase A subunit